MYAPVSLSLSLSCISECCRYIYIYTYVKNSVYDNEQKVIGFSPLTMKHRKWPANHTPCLVFGGVNLPQHLKHSFVENASPKMKIQLCIWISIGAAIYLTIHLSIDRLIDLSKICNEVLLSNFRAWQTFSEIYLTIQLWSSDEVIACQGFK